MARVVAFLQNARTSRSCAVLPLRDRWGELLLQALLPLPVPLVTNLTRRRGYSAQLKLHRDVITYRELKAIEQVSRSLAVRFHRDAADGRADAISRERATVEATGFERFADEIKSRRAQHARRFRVIRRRSVRALTQLGAAFAVSGFGPLLETAAPLLI
jgi:hypothetical protein